MHRVYGIEGLDRIGKSTLIQGILDTLGYYQVVHFAKPQSLNIYTEAGMKEAFQGDGPIYSAFHDEEGVPLQRPASLPIERARAAFHYQSASFRNSMLLANSNARIIFDRWHIGEVVYSPMYRGYRGDYVYDQERQSGLAERTDVRLILLLEDFMTARHFVDDGQSLGPIEKREEEQRRFITAFNQSNIKDKRTIVVTDPRTGGFYPKEEILEMAIS